MLLSCINLEATDTDATPGGFLVDIINKLGWEYLQI